MADDTKIPPQRTVAHRRSAVGNMGFFEVMGCCFISLGLFVSLSILRVTMVAISSPRSTFSQRTRHTPAASLRKPWPENSFSVVGMHRRRRGTAGNFFLTFIPSSRIHLPIGGLVSRTIRCPISPRGGRRAESRLRLAARMRMHRTAGEAVHPS